MREIIKGRVAYFVADGADFLQQADADSLEQYFAEDFLKLHAHDLRFCGGRGQTWLFSLQGQDLVLRRYLRGGLWGKIIKSSFWRFSALSRRARLELQLCEKMRALGLPVPEAVAGREECGLLWRRNALISRQIPHSRNLAEIIASRPLTAAELSHIGCTLARFFRCGILHTDLNIRNILLASGQCWVIDFDKCAARDKLSAAEIAGMLQRLSRSFNKEKRLRPQVCFAPQDFALLQEACLTALHQPSGIPPAP